MIQFKCGQIEYRVPFVELLPFQGNLKKRSQEDIQNLAQSLLTDGMLMPFVLWHKDGLMYILDGHARHSAIQYIAETDPEVLAQSYPAILIEAQDLETAKVILLQISSQYGKITAKGLTGFVANSPKINLQTMGIHLPTLQVKADKPKLKDKTLIRIRVADDKLTEFKAILSKFDFVEVL